MERDLTPEERAVLRYLRRNCLLPGQKEDPAGRYNNWRWYPAPEEARPCCAKVRRPTHRWPFSLLDHCRTLVHCCNLEGADLAKARKILRRYRQALDLAESTKS